MAHNRWCSIKNFAEPDLVVELSIVVREETIPAQNAAAKQLCAVPEIVEAIQFFKPRSLFDLGKKSGEHAALW